ncbi:uncharacterized protein Dwil_GK24437 [Drosophila willistoni]|uniref:Uncharacterized protein n=1 Tax=Drosophila willistoni TaxID=7260 RepID=A0A0Q9WYS3_DROWI|nr:uncharacterized protein LOC6643886 [Drosophila willistoni]KRF98718.1 uncharacterized protein Dwil_GK24437 [Drosophila willistoni]
MSFSYKNKNFYLDSLPGLGNLEQDVQAKIVAQMEAKIKRIWEGAYFDPDALCEMKESVPYSLNIDEFWHHSVPFVNKIFVVVLTNLNTGGINLVYAVNCCLNCSPETKRFLTKADEVTDAIVLVMQQVPPRRHKNIVALVSDRDRMNVRASTSCGV